MKNPTAPDLEWHKTHASFILAQTQETAPDAMRLYKLAFWVHAPVTKEVAAELRRIADQMEKGP
jgi:hypothetical protein